MRGKFIVVEGPDGTGKTTLVENLTKALNARGILTIKTREPGGSSIGGDIRRLLFDKSHRMDNLTNALLVSAERRHHLLTLIEPYLAAGTWVICDRYVLSTLVYQGSTPEIMETINVAIREFDLPDLTILLTAAPEVAIPRLMKRGDLNHFDAITPEAYQARTDAYLAVHPSHYTHEYHLINKTDGTPEELLDMVMQCLGDTDWMEG